MKLTPWFSGDLKPVRVGPYPRQFVDKEFYSFWNGHFWGFISTSLELAYENREFHSLHQCLPWRGLLKESK